MNQMLAELLSFTLLCLYVVMFIPLTVQFAVDGFNGLSLSVEFLKRLDWYIYDLLK